LDSSIWNARTKKDLKTPIADNIPSSPSVISFSSTHLMMASTCIPPTLVPLPQFQAFVPTVCWTCLLGCVIDTPKLMQGDRTCDQPLSLPTLNTIPPLLAKVKPRSHLKLLFPSFPTFSTSHVYRLYPEMTTFHNLQHFTSSKLFCFYFSFSFFLFFKDRISLYQIQDRPVSAGMAGR
jgi:hypothetical protein